MRKTFGYEKQVFLITGKHPTAAKKMKALALHLAKRSDSCKSNEGGVFWGTNWLKDAKLSQLRLATETHLERHDAFSYCELQTETITFSDHISENQIPVNVHFTILFVGNEGFRAAHVCDGRPHRCCWFDPSSKTDCASSLGHLWNHIHSTFIIY